MTHIAEGGRDRDQELAVNSPWVLMRYRAQQATTGLARERSPSSSRGRGRTRAPKTLMAGLGPWQVTMWHTLVSLEFFKMDTYCSFKFKYIAHGQQHSSPLNRRWTTSQQFSFPYLYPLCEHPRKPEIYTVNSLGYKIPNFPASIVLNFCINGIFYLLCYNRLYETDGTKPFTAASPFISSTTLMQQVLLLSPF